VVRELRRREKFMDSKHAEKYNELTYRYYPSGGAEANMQPWEPNDSTKPL
jgi:hypothetical protein